MNELNELQVVVNQEVGAIHWNFEELKTALAAEMKKYEGIEKGYCLSAETQDFRGRSEKGSQREMPGTV